ncbi:MAG TPA: DUF4384 domain-containing protein [Candidatus Brocadiia bacterium]|nr:DUF4384 domain-containing protein [Candidatus Brocadiia bacterium]
MTIYTKIRVPSLFAVVFLILFSAGLRAQEGGVAYRCIRMQMKVSNGLPPSKFSNLEADLVRIYSDKAYAAKVVEFTQLLGAIKVTTDGGGKEWRARRLDVAFVKRGENGIEEKALMDGQVVHDRNLNQQAADKYRIIIETEADTFLYVTQMDSTGKIDVIFPNPVLSDVRNPITSGSSLRIPDGEQGFTLDTNRGIEKVYFIASPKAVPELEALLEYFVKATPQLPKPKGVLNVEKEGCHLAVDTGYKDVENKVKSRGISGVQPVDSLPLAASVPSAEPYASTGDAMVITRFFTHEE